MMRSLIPRYGSAFLLPACLALSGCGLHSYSPAELAAIRTDPLPAHPEQGPFLFCYFLGNGDGLHLAWSPDGLKFTPLGGAQRFFLKPTIGTNIDGSPKDQHLMRDPCIRQGPDGRYHMVWTTGWYQRGIGVSNSPDLLHWAPEQFVEVMKGEPTAINSWAPELFYDDATGKWLIFWASTIPGKFTETLPGAGDLKQADKGGPKNDVPLNHRIYYVTTKDFITYSETHLLYDPGFNCIDATMTKLPSGKYLMVLKDETKVPVPKKNLRTAVADSAEGPWSPASAPISIDWVEGPTIARVGDGWNVYYDEYTRKKYGAIRTTDFLTWELVTKNFSFPKGSRHGTVFPVSPAVVERLKASAWWLF